MSTCCCGRITAPARSNCTPTLALGRRTADDARIERYRQLFAFAGATAPATPAPPPNSIAASTRRRAGAWFRVPLALLAALHGRVSIAIVTNNTVAEQTEKLATFTCAPYVDALVTSEEVGTAKPGPAIFAHALARLRVSGRGSGDGRRLVGNDVEGAAGIGMRALWFNRLAPPTRIRRRPRSRRSSPRRGIAGN